jgi:hypothetical protein
VVRDDDRADRCVDLDEHGRAPRQGVPGSVTDMKVDLGEKSVRPAGRNGSAHAPVGS